jgi:hypothetical protein
MKCLVRWTMEGVAELDGRSGGEPGVIEGEGNLVEVEGAVEGFGPGEAQEVVCRREEAIETGGLALDGTKVA